MFRVCKVLVIFFLCLDLNETSDPVIPLEQGYYWRDYDGGIPSDALPGGIQSSGKRTYIGQALHNVESYLVVGEIRPDEGVIHYEMNGPRRVSKNIRILCTEHPEMYTWVRISIKEMKKSLRRHWVVGGYEKLRLYIGRISDEGETVVGKINLDHFDEEWTGLWITHNGIKVLYPDMFELLVYNPNGTKKEVSKTNTKIVQFNIYT